MKNNIAILLLLTVVMTACGTFKKANTNPDTTTTTQTTPQSNPTDRCGTVLATLGTWQSLQTGGNIKLNAGSNFSSSVQVRMVRDEAIYISLRPMLGIEAGKLVITADSLYAVDKIHKRYVAEKVSILTSGIPVTVTEVQDIFLGRPFIIGKGTLNETLKPLVTTSESDPLTLTANESFKGYNYSFSFDKSSRITSLDIVPTGSSTAAYQVKYSDVKGTTAGNIAHAVNINANVEKKKLAFSLSYKDIDWNGKVKIDKSIPNGYSRMRAQDLFSMFSN